MPKQQTKETIWNRCFVQLLLVEAVLQMGSYLTRPILANYAVQLGAALTGAGFIVGLAMLSAMILRPLTGFLSDRTSKKKSLLISAAAFAISAFGIALASNTAIMATFCIVQGVALAFKSVSVVSLAAMSVPQSRLGTGVGVIGLMNTFAMAAAPAVGTVIATITGYSVCFLLAGVLCTIGFILAATYKPPTASSLPVSGTEETDALETTGARTDVNPQNTTATRQSKFVSLINQAFYLPAIPYALIALFSLWGHASVSALILTVADMGYVENGALYFTVYAVCALVTRPISGRLSDSVGVAVVGIPGFLLGAAGLLLLVFFHSTVFVVLAGICMGIGQSAAHCAIQAESVRGVDVGHLGRASNTFYIGMDLGAALGPTVSGFILQTGNPAWLFASVSATCIIAAVLLLVLQLSQRRS